MVFRKFYAVLSLSVLTCLSTPVQAADILQLYRDRDYAGVIAAQGEAGLADLPDDALYYTALSHVQKKDFAKAREGLGVLLSRDADFYAYKLGFDQDWLALQDQTETKALLESVRMGRTLAEHRGHKIVQNAGGTFLFRNGVRQRLEDATVKIGAIGFTDEGSVTYATRILPANKSDHERTGVVFYDAKSRQKTAAMVLDGVYTGISVTGGDKLVVQTSAGFQIFRRQSAAALTPFLSGNFLGQNDALRHVTYSALDPKTKKSGTLVYSY